MAKKTETAVETVKTSAPAVLPTYTGDVAIQNDAMDESLMGNGFMASLRLLTSQSNQVKAGKFPVNHYGLFRGGDPEDLGLEVDAIVLTWRAKAFDMSDTDAINTVYDPKTPEWIDIVRRSKIKDSGCSYGPEYLLYIPSLDVYATFFASSISARNEAKNVNNFLPVGGVTKSATFHSRFIEAKKYSWQLFQIRQCPNDLFVPDADAYLKAFKDFMNPEAEKKELAPEAEGEDDSRR